MDNKLKLIWDNRSDQDIFESAGICEFDDFWDIENNDSIDLQVRRQHIKEGDKVERQTVRVPLNGIDYFLKRTSNTAYQCIINEYNAIEYVAEFGIVPPLAVTHCFDDTTKRGFILFKSRDDFYCLDDIYRDNLSEEVKHKIGNHTKYHKKIISIFKEFQKSKYFYRDWMSKHIFINPDTDEIGLIDLERFLPKSKLPFHWSLPFIYGYKRKKERLKLIKALKISKI